MAVFVCCGDPWLISYVDRETKGGPVCLWTAIWQSWKNIPGVTRLWNILLFLYCMVSVFCVDLQNLYSFDWLKLYTDNKSVHVLNSQFCASTVFSSPLLSWGMTVEDSAGWNQDWENVSYTHNKKVTHTSTIQLCNHSHTHRHIHTHSKNLSRTLESLNKHTVTYVVIHTHTHAPTHSLTYIDTQNEHKQYRTFTRTHTHLCTYSLTHSHTHTHTLSQICPG